jgi:D-aminopeptidase
MQELLGPSQTDVEGKFHCSEIDADLVCISAGGAMYGTFEGFLGKSAAQPNVCNWQRRLAIAVSAWA